MTTYRLASAAFVHAPGLIAWAVNGYAFEADRSALTEIVSKTWAVPVPATQALLSQQVPFTLDGDTVVFSA